MAIDNPYDAIDAQYPEDERAVASAIAKVLGVGAALGIPIPPVVSQFFGFLDTMSGEAKQARGVAFLRQLVEDMQRVLDSIGTMRTEMNEIQSAIRIALEYDVEEFNDAKRDRYVSAITCSISSETKVHDVVSFIQDIERLGERDLIGLKVLNRVMNRESDWKDNPGVPQLNPSKLHPTTFTSRAQELAVQMAHALTGNSSRTDGNIFSREDGLQICLRLQGFGLAQVIDDSPREVPISNYSARPTTSGLDVAEADWRECAELEPVFRSRRASLTLCSTNATPSDEPRGGRWRPPEGALSDLSINI
jgi:hypothetical protein